MATKSATLLQLSRLGLRICTSKDPSCGAGALSCLSHVSPHLHAHCCSSYSSSVKVRSYLQYMKHKIIPTPSPPYKHVCQVGDPVLRSRAAAVDPTTIRGAEIQKVINTMVKVMRKHDCVGLSAPQIGVPLRILALEYPEKMLEESSPVSREVRGLSAQPLRVFVNPHLRVLDGRTVLFQEACESISGYSATVPRYLSVEVSGTCLFPKSIIGNYLSNLSERANFIGYPLWFTCMFPLQVWMRRVKMLCGKPVVGQLESSSTRWITWMESSTSTGWTARHSSILIVRHLTDRGHTATLL